MRYIPALECTVSHLGAVDGSPLFMSADTPEEQLGYRIKSKLAGLGQQDVRRAHEQVGTVYRLKDVLMPEGVDTVDLTVHSGVRERLGIAPVIEVSLAELRETVDIGDQLIPYGFVIAYVDIQRRLARPHGRYEVLYHSREQLFLSAGSAYGQQKSHRLAVALAAYTRVAVMLDSGDQLMVDIVTRVHKILSRYGLEYLILTKSVKNTISHIALVRLDGMRSSLGEVQSHRPVVGDSVDHIFHPRVQRRLSRPHMSAYDRDILGDVPENRRHKLGVLLIRRVVAELTEALIVHRLPYGLVEHPALL